MATIKLLTFNIAHGRGLSFYQGFHSHAGIVRNLDLIADLFREYSPDIVALQEVDVRSHWNRRIDLLAHVKYASGYSFAEAGVHNRREGRHELAYGNAVLSRYPFVKSSVHPFGKSVLGEKGYMYTEVDVGGVPVPLVNLHLDYKSRKKRVDQVEQLISWMGGNGAGVGELPIICGDFNCTSKSESDGVAHLLRHVRIYDEYAIYPQKAATFPAHLPFRQLDFILLPSRFTKVKCRVIPCWLSDHRPVMVTFEG